MNRGIAILPALLIACASAAPPRSQALWSRSITGGVTNASIYRGTVTYGIEVGFNQTFTTQALDARTGRLLWKRSGAVPLRGSQSFLAVGQAVERIDTRTGRVLWRSPSLCGKTTPVASPSYAAVIGQSVYIGCAGGELFGLSLSNGTVFASGYPASLDNYDQIASLGHDTLGIGGVASGAYMFRQSSIVKAKTLSTVAALGPDNRIVGTWRGDALIADTCCQGRHRDSWPANIARVSLTSGKVVSEVALHPYERPPTGNSNLPGPGVIFVHGDTLYAGTHTALFAYDVANLQGRPRVLFADLANLPTVIDDRYVWIEEGTPLNVRRVAVLDGDNGMRAIWTDSTGRFAPGYPHPNQAARMHVAYVNGHVRITMVDASCLPGVSDETYVFMVCRSEHVASLAHLGAPATPVTFRNNTLLPETIAVYAIPQ